MSDRIRKAFIFILPNNTNLLRWKKVDSALCTLCKTNNSNAIIYAKQLSSSVRSGRYTFHNSEMWHTRHNSILYMMCHYLPEFENAGIILYADLTSFKSPTELFNRLIPDIVLAKNDKLIVIESTYCFETNFTKSRRYKSNRYENIKKTIRTLNGRLTKYLLKYPLWVL